METAIAPQEAPSSLEEFGLHAPETPELVLENSRLLRSITAEEAAESERLGRMSDRMAAAMRASGVLQMAFPAHRGGVEAPLAVQTQVIEQIATADGGIAWNAGVLAATGFYAGRLGDEAFAELYPTLNMPTAGCFWPRGRAEIVDGGYLVTGTWQTGSGMQSAPYVLGGCEVFRDGEPVLKDNGAPLVLALWLRTEDVEIFDDWYVLGMRASSSNGYAVRDRFVPESHTFDRYFTPGTYRGPLETLPELPFYSMQGIPVGIAQHAVDLAAAKVIANRERGREPDARVIGQLGECESLVRSARAAVIAGAERIDALLFSGEVPTPYDAVGSEGTVATELAQRVVHIVSDIVGSAFIYDKNPYEKLARDLYPLAVHGTGKPSMWVSTGHAVLEHYSDPTRGMTR
ncbi:hypothetical protein P0L94_12390 [Microbacter sp. GSS18]|nr:hypothetical protein P0L94_12390 [Microbacter sp. GSS18]